MEGTYVYLWLIHVDVWQKLTQHCKAVIHQLKIKKTFTSLSSSNWRKQLRKYKDVYPLQCTCLENPRDGGGWWAAVYGVAQSRTQLKRLSSSSSGITLIDL